MNTIINAKLVKELRDNTGVSVMQCKNALEEAGGDMEKALIILKKKSSSIAMKKADRNAKDGLIIIKEKNNKAILLALHTETDFVSKNEDFINLANKLIDIAIDKGIEEMKKESTDLINEIVQKVGEKIELGKVIELSGPVISYYVHNNKSGTIVSLSGGNKELARDIAMHISAMKPSYMNEKEITEEDKKKVLEVFQKEVDAIEDKSKDVKSKILAGKISTYFKEQTLLNQNFIKNPELSIERLLANNKAQIDSFIYESII